MTLTFSTLRETIAKRAKYRKTVRELRAMPLDVALDLEIHQPDAERIAYDAVYGPSSRA